MEYKFSIKPEAPGWATYTVTMPVTQPGRCEVVESAGKVATVDAINLYFGGCLAVLGTLGYSTLAHLLEQAQRMVVGALMRELENRDPAPTRPNLDDEHPRIVN